MSIVVNSRINEWLQMIAAIGVIVGLGLVAFEIRETNKLAFSESVRDQHRAFIDFSIAELETDIYGAYVKSFETPENLTSEEIMELGAWLTANMALYDMWHDMHRLGMSRQDGIESLIGQVDGLFGSKFGRAWYSLNRVWIEPALVEALDRELEGRPILSGAPSVEAIRPHL